MRLLFLIILLVFAIQGQTQVGINTDGSSADNSAMLDVKSTVKGLLPPRLTTAQRDLIGNPSVGLLIFNTDCNDLQFFNGSAWTPMGNHGLIGTPGSITGNATPCAQGTGVIYSVGTVTNATGYHWTPPPGASVVTGQGSNTIAVNFGSGGGPLCVSAFNDCYRSMPSCLTITLSPVIYASVSVSANATTVCQGIQVTFTATPVNGGQSPVYQWKKNNVDIPGATNSTYAYAPLHNDKISCRMTSNAPCVAVANVYSSAVTMTVLSSQPVSVSVGASANNICAGTQVTFSATPVNGGTSPAYQWRKNGNDITGATNNTYTYAPSNGDGISCVVTSNITCPSGNPATSNTITMTVNPVVPVSVTIAASANPSCAGSSVIFTATPVNGGASPVYQWRVNGISTGTNSPVYAYVPLNNDEVTCSLYSSETCATGNPATSNTITMTINLPVAVSVSISANATLVCSGTQVTYTAAPTNGGANPGYQWKKNGVNVSGATISTYTYTPANNDVVTCQMTSSLTCVTGNPATSNAITMTVIAAQPVSITITPSANPVCAGTSVIFTSGIVNGGTSPLYQWRVNGSNITGATANSYTYVPLHGDQVSCVLTSNVLCGTGSPATSNIITMSTSLSINHVTTGGVAPVNKQTNYGTVRNIPGETSKCWITSNLGSNSQASTVNDATENAAGWYWQFNRKQGYRHTGSSLTPAWTVTTISENTDWQSGNDPCSIELGGGWRIPSFTEWSNVDNTGGWTNWTGPWNSGLKLHAAGYLMSSNGSLTNRGIHGHYWSTKQNGLSLAHYLGFNSITSQMDNNFKTYGFPLRCLRDN